MNADTANKAIEAAKARAQYQRQMAVTAAALRRTQARNTK